MQAKNKTRLEELEKQSGNDESKLAAVEWIDENDERFINYNGKRYNSEEFRKLYPKVKIFRINFV